jgi:hypothetical protein
MLWAMEATAAPLGRLWRTLRLWVDSDAPPTPMPCSGAASYRSRRCTSLVSA